MSSKQKHKPEDTSDTVNSTTVAQSARFSDKDQHGDPMTKSVWGYDLLENFCKQSTWKPASIDVDKIKTVIDLGIEKGRKVELILFAWVQYFDFVWEDDHLLFGHLIGYGDQEEVWYKPNSQLTTTAYGRRVPFDEKKYPVTIWKPFMQAFGFPLKKQDVKETYLEGVYTILKKYPRLRRYPDRSVNGKYGLVPRTDPQVVEILDDDAAGPDADSVIEIPESPTGVPDESSSDSDLDSSDSDPDDDEDCDNSDSDTDDLNAISFDKDSGTIERDPAETGPEESDEESSECDSDSECQGTEDDCFVNDDRKSYQVHLNESDIEIEEGQRSLKRTHDFAAEGSFDDEDEPRFKRGRLRLGEDSTCKTSYKGFEGHGTSGIRQAVEELVSISQYQHLLKYLYHQQSTQQIPSQELERPRLGFSAHVSCNTAPVQNSFEFAPLVSCDIAPTKPNLVRAARTFAKYVMQDTCED